MRVRCRSVGLLVCGLLLASGAPLFAQTAQDTAVRVSATVQTSPPRITLTWPAITGATNYSVARKLPADTVWGTVKSLGVTTNYTDSNVSAGLVYEYQFLKYGTNGTYTSYGYIAAALQSPLVESRGKVVLIVDSTHTVALSNELAQLQQDLVGDGWRVARYDVPPSQTVPNVKALIQAEYLLDTNNVKSVFLFGHVPVPYSGDTAPDGHGNHVGAWPADVYYGDMDGTWTDIGVNDTSASDPRNRNVPGDGKFDQSYEPSFVDLQVGRVDLSNMPQFPLSEQELLRQYLNKDHNYRHKVFTAQPRGLVDDNFGYFGGEAFAASGWRNFSAFFGAGNVSAQDWFTELPTQSYQWAYGCGGGSYTSASGVGNTAQFMSNATYAVFTMLFGSYHGDWDSQNNFMRAALANSGYGLTCAWAGRPHWQFHHMGVGEPIGYSTRLTQNYIGGLYGGGFASSGVHVALMGDPTLRQHVVAPAAGLKAIANAATGVNVSWNTSPDSVLGYNLYKSTTLTGVFTRLNPALMAGTNFTDASSIPLSYYMVRAVKLENTTGGSYTNASQGILVQYNPPVITTASVLPAAIQNISYSLTLAVSGGVPGYTWAVIAGALPAGLSLSVTGVLSGTSSVLGTSTFTVQVTDSSGATDNATFSLTVQRPYFITTGSPLPSGVSGNAYSRTFGVTGGVSPYTWSVTSGVLPNGLTLSVGGTLSGTPTIMGTFNFTVMVADNTGDIASQSYSLTIAPPPLVITVGSLANGRVGTAYSQTLTASGGVTPLTWSVTSGILPDGLALDASGNLAGTPRVAGTFSFIARVTDSVGANANQSLSITIIPAPLAITSSSPLPGGVAGSAYAQTLVAIGGVPGYTWLVSAGALPSGLVLSAAGAISGTPTVAGTFNFTAQVTDSASVTATKAFAITIAPPPLVITSSFTLPGGAVGSAYSQTLAASGGTPSYTWSVSAGALPAGLVLSAAGAISGTPTMAGTFNFTAQVTDSASVTATKAFAITIAPPPLVITSSSTLPGGAVGSAYSQTLAATGGTPGYTWSVSAGAMPSGVVLSTAGAISGTPTVAGTFSFTVQVTDSASVTTTKAFAITIAPPPLVITSSSPLPDGGIGSAYSQTLVATGGTPGYTWSLTAGAMPSGLVLSAAGTISGMPTVAGTFNFTVQVTDSASVSVTKAFAVTIAPTSLVITSSSPLPAGMVGNSYSQTLAATGGAPAYTWSVSAGAMPAGLVLSAAGTISGTPTVAGTFNFTMQVTDSTSVSVAKALAITIAPPPLVITSTSPLTSGTVGSVYSQTLTASGGTPGYAWSLAAGALPAGVVLSVAGVLSGTPTAVGTFNFTAQVNDSGAQSVSQAFALPIRPVPQPGTLQFSASNYSVAENGGPITITVTRSGGSDGAVTVNYATSNGTATSGTDYAPTSGTLNWADGESGGKSFAVTVLPDALVEGDETVLLALSAPTNGAALGNPSAAVLRITDWVPGSIQFSAVDYAADETGTNATIRVTRTGGADGAVAVDYATADGTAHAGSDYTATVGTMNFSASETNHTFNVPIINGTAVEGSKNVHLLLSNPVGGAMIGSQSNAVLTIQDDDAGWLGRRQPDAMIKGASEALYRGNNIYNLTGANQSLSQTARRGQKRVFHLKVQNDGQAADAFAVQGDGGAAGFVVKYFVGTSSGADITAAVVDRTYVVPNVAVGASVVLRIEVTVSATASVGAMKSLLVTATSMTDPAKKDAVKATVLVIP